MKPSEMHPLINEEMQKKALRYAKKKDLFNIVRLLISGVYLFTFYLSGISQTLSSFSLSFSLPLALVIYILLLVVPLLIILYSYTSLLHST